MIIGGSIEYIALGGRIYQVSADADVTINTGGKNITVNVFGDGGAGQQQQQIPWSVKDVEVGIDEDQATLQGLDDFRAKGGGDVEVKLGSGVVYMGEGTIVGDIEMSTMKSTAKISLGGGGKLRQQ